MDEILRILTENARTSLADIAAMTGGNEADVANAIEAYEKDGTIIKYKAVLNSQNISDADGTVRAWIAVNVTPQRDAGFDAIAERLYHFDEVRSCYLLSGSFDLLLQVEGSSLKKVASFVAEKLSTLEEVTGTATYFLLKAYKEDGDVLERPKESHRLAVAP